MNPMAQTPGQLVPLEKIIKTEQVQNLGFLSAEEKAKYQLGIANLWKKLQENPPNHPEHISSHSRLSEVTNRLKQQILKWKQSQGQIPQQNFQPPPTQARPTGMMQMPVNDGRQAPQPEFSQRVRNEAKNLPVTLPMSLKSRPAEEQQQWANGQRLKYAKILQHYENTERQMNELQQQVNARAASTGMSEQDKHNATQRMVQLRHMKAEAQKQAMTLKQQHEHARQQQQQQQYANAQQAVAQAGISGQVPSLNQNAAPRPPVEASEQDAIKEEDSKPNVQNEEKSSVPASGATQGPNSQVQGTQNQPQFSASGIPAEVSVKSEPNVAGSPNIQSGPTKPLSHQDAIMRASQNHPQSNQPTHGHPTQPQSSAPQQREQPNTNSTLAQRPQNRPLNVAPPSAVSLPAARPTLPGGPGSMGPMGQPAIQKHPGFVLEGEGERVLSKKKLEELVRQVTGGGVASEGGESLDPDVEEVNKMRSTLTFTCSRALTHQRFCLTLPTSLLTM